MPQRHDQRRGFTMVELLISVALVAILGTVAGVLMRDVFFLNSVVSDGFLVQQEIRRSFRIMSAEMRTAAISDTGAYPIDTAGTSTFIFYSDIDGDGNRDRVRYYLFGTTLRRGIIAPTGNPSVYNGANEVFSTLITNVSNSTSTPVFWYYDTTYAGTTSPLSSPIDVPSVRLVKTEIISDRNPNRPPLPQTFTTQVNLRNLKDNYDD